jgi:hypothetical protein
MPCGKERTRSPAATEVGEGQKRREEIRGTP